jgi:hypothetical protein
MPPSCKKTAAAFKRILALDLVIQERLPKAKLLPGMPVTNDSTSCTQQPFQLLHILKASVMPDHQAAEKNWLLRSIKKVVRIMSLRLEAG